MPNHSWWETQNYKKGKKLAEGFIYTSNNNDQWLSVDDLRKIIYGPPLFEQDQTSKLLSTIHQLNERVILNMLNSEERIPEGSSSFTVHR